MKSYLTSAVLGIDGNYISGHLRLSIEGALRALHQSTGGTNELAIENLERRIAGEQRVITDAETVLSQLDASVQTLIDYDRIRGDSGAIAVRQSQAEERASLNETIDEAYANIEDLSGQLTYAKRKQLEIEVEVGPLKYIAELIYGDKAEGYFDEAVRAVILLLIITFDPLAVVLLLAATQGFQQQKKEKMMMFNPENVADMENNFDIVKVDMDDYTIIEDAIPDDDDIDDYEVMEPEPPAQRSGKKRRVRKK